MQQNNTHEFSDKNTILVGHKPASDYVLAIATQSTMYNCIRIKARGFNINKAVDASQIALREFLTAWVQSDARIGTEQNKETAPGDRPQRISFIEIDLVKKTE